MVPVVAEDLPIIVEYQLEANLEDPRNRFILPSLIDQITHYTRTTENCFKAVNIEMVKVVNEDSGEIIACAILRIKPPVGMVCVSMSAESDPIISVGDSEDLKKFVADFLNYDNFGTSSLSISFWDNANFCQYSLTIPLCQTIFSQTRVGDKTSAPVPSKSCICRFTIISHISANG